MLVILGGAWDGGRAAESSRALEFPANAIFSKDPNQSSGDVLDITRGRGAASAWNAQAAREEEVRVLIEYACAKALNQDYLLSLDGVDRFWTVPPTGEGEWRRVEIGRFRLRAGLPVFVQRVPPTGTKYVHRLRSRRLTSEMGYRTTSSVSPRSRNRSRRWRRRDSGASRVTLAWAMAELAATDAHPVQVADDLKTNIGLAALAGHDRSNLEPSVSHVVLHA